MVPHRTPFFLPYLYPSLTWRIPTAARELYLTFDDGPVNGPTEFVLDTLAGYHAKATFFCIGDNVRKHPEVFKRIIKEGHGVGNHTYHHMNGWKNSAEQYHDNIGRCTQIMEATATESLHADVRLFRPPYGRVTRRQIRDLQKRYTVVMWDVLSIDYNRNLEAEACLHNTIKACRPGSIIVFHDSVKAEKNLTYALPRLLKHFTEQSYTFKKLPA